MKQNELEAWLKPLLPQLLQTRNDIERKELLSLDVTALAKSLAQENLSIWSTIVRGFKMNWHHNQWCELCQNTRYKRVALLAPREHSKTETFSINFPLWIAARIPGFQVQIFSLTGDLAEDILQRIVTVIDECFPNLKNGASTWRNRKIVLENRSSIVVKGYGTATRGGHPDLIIADDILDMSNSGSEYQRAKVKQWWFEVITNMSKPGTRIFLVGTPQHQQDLIMSLKANSTYLWRKYAALYDGEKYPQGYEEA